MSATSSCLMIIPDISIVAISHKTKKGKFADFMTNIQRTSFGYFSRDEAKYYKVSNPTYFTGLTKYINYGRPSKASKYTEMLENGFRYCDEFNMWYDIDSDGEEVPYHITSSDIKQIVKTLKKVFKKWNYYDISINSVEMNEKFMNIELSYCSIYIVDSNDEVNTTGMLFDTYPIFDIYELDSFIVYITRS